MRRTCDTVLVWRALHARCGFGSKCVRQKAFPSIPYFHGRSGSIFCIKYVMVWARTVMKITLFLRGLEPSSRIIAFSPTTTITAGFFHIIETTSFRSKGIMQQGKSDHVSRCVARLRARWNNRWNSSVMVLVLTLMIQRSVNVFNPWRRSPVNGSSRLVQMRARRYHCLRYARLHRLRCGICRVTCHCCDKSFANHPNDQAPAVTTFLILALDILTLSLSLPLNMLICIYTSPLHSADLSAALVTDVTNAFVSAQRCHKTALPLAKKGAQLCSVFFRDGKGTCCQPSTALRVTLQERPLMLNIVDVVLESVFHF